ncbi:F-box/FBD/LRR-repeat protein At2g04230-like isoform X2 [Rhododendron vialii]|uniref:F-box/FBD/LRR-repeat protein At2g04230-like isoform X2 n=1 Tax=Rhododendron vialii TaxID=182163 RepID=UPI00265DE7E6|nr:F-box/FBD/LRR-repeat protein At2g04230-like isoform X2 [Rhododendron vialii]
MASPAGGSSSAVARPPTTLDDLPPSLLLRIISSLSTLDAIQTTLISPAFLDLWTSLPSLSFDFSLFLPPCDTPSQTLRAFSDFVTRAFLLRHPPSSSPLRSLHLRLDSATHHLPYRRHIDSWIHYAVAHDVESLSLTFSSKYLLQFLNETTDSYYYPFPLPLLRNGSVRSLHLKHCNLDVPRNTSRTRLCESLASIDFVQVYLTDERISDLVAGCLNIEALTIRQCHGMKEVKISSPSLKRLDLWQFRCDEGSVEIRAPNLSNLRMFFFEVGEYVMEDSSAVEEADVTCISMVENYRYWIKIVRLLSHVKRFHVQNWWYKIFGARISEEFERINFNLPSLGHLKLNCYWGTMDELHFLRLVLKSEVVLERIVLHPVRLDQNSVIPIVLVKRTQGFQVVQGSFPGCGLQVYQGMDVYQGMEISCLIWR